MTSAIAAAALARINWRAGGKHLGLCSSVTTAVVDLAVERSQSRFDLLQGQLAVLESG